MEKRQSGFSLFSFITQYAPIGILPGMWFAYIAGISIAWGALAGLIAVVAVGLPTAFIRRERQRRRRMRRHWLRRL